MIITKSGFFVIFFGLFNRNKIVILAFLLNNLNKPFEEIEKSGVLALVISNLVFRLSNGLNIRKIRSKLPILVISDLKIKCTG